MTLGELIRTGTRAVRTWWRLILSIYLAQLAVGLLMGFVTMGTLATVYGDRPLFDRGVDGDFVALMMALRERGITVPLIWSGLGLALGWALLSFYLTPGLLGVMAGRPFGEAARRGFWPFVRLSLWSLVPAAIALLLAGGLGAHGVGIETLHDRRDVFAALVRGLPGLLILGVVFCAVDYARAELVVQGTTGAGRALLRAFRLVLTRPLPTLHYFLYCVSVLVLALAYLVVSRPLFGLLLFLLRQLFLAARFAARVATSAGQVELVRTR